MAVCGRCWACGAKFDCATKQSCGDCTEDGPARVTWHRDVGAAFICGLCVQAIESGVVGDLITALRSAVDTYQTHVRTADEKEANHGRQDD